ncbi:hypothetical protein EV127DRAFT_498288 [Xylaria flabelliformis]|nr:hypothetical protein EV127DRAFT_498288 [Xylaria flabelliformis]
MLPQNINDDAELWNVLLSRRNLFTEWPNNRVNAAGFRACGAKGDIPIRGGCFVKQDPAIFDGPFFSMTAGEAAAIDPSHRWALQTSYHAFENAGISIEQLNGSHTAVFGACMSDDYKTMLLKDAQSSPRTAATGVAPSIFANRISWFFNLLGPSVVVDTACSGTMVALDLACQSLRNGDATMALVIGASLSLTPESTAFLDNMGFLSPDGYCYSFDQRANGYARGEGVLAVLVKPLSNALADNDMIRAVIRSSGSNQDGRTPSLTQPNATSQEDLIRAVYRKAGLDPGVTRYVEAHGTGTPLGDPIEATALRRAFGEHRSQDEPLYVGSIKTNIGHLESGSGLAGIVKTVLILEKGIIPPNALLQKVNPAIDTGSGKLIFPKETVAWPATGLRRASVNSFGIGGTNAHVVLDDACQFLHTHGLQGSHLCHMGLENSRDLSSPIQLLVWSASDENAVRRTLMNFEAYFKCSVVNTPEKMSHLVHTLTERRSRLAWRVSITLDVTEPFEVESVLALAKPIRASSRSALAFIFTGQGAQYVNMGLELIQYYPVFAKSLEDIGRIYAELGCPWNLVDELRNKDHVGLPEYSQPICCALQISLVKLLRELGVTPSAIVGHSSGEIAAAYAAGALSEKNACVVAYYRGQLAAKLKRSTTACHSMMSVNLSEREVPTYLTSHAELPPSAKQVQIACVNSPSNCTLAGADDAMCSIQKLLEQDGVFAQKLDIGLAYHSPEMLAIAPEYLELLARLKHETLPEAIVPMVSSVTGKLVSASALREPQYWVDNLVSRVRFSDAILELSQLPEGILPSSRAITDVVEIGPRPALRRPINDTLKTAPLTSGKKTPAYYSLLHKNQRPLRTFLELIGQLFCLGYPVCLSALSPPNGQVPSLLVDYPNYPFSQTLRYWAEPRLSRNSRLPQGATNDLLGCRSHDENPLHPSWRKINGLPLFPGAGALVMTVEAVAQEVPPSLHVTGYLFKEARFLNPIIIEEKINPTEIALYLRPNKDGGAKDYSSYEVKIYAHHSDRWVEFFTGNIQVEIANYNTTNADGDEEFRLMCTQLSNEYAEAKTVCNKSVRRQAFYEFSEKIGLRYLESFQLLHEIAWDGRRAATASFAGPFEKLFHPTVLDASLQLTLVPVSDGLSPKTNARVPSRLRNTWISAAGWDAVSANASVSVKLMPGGRDYSAVVRIFSDTGRPLLHIEDLLMKAITNHASNTFDGSSNRLLFGISWKPQISLQTRQQLRELCQEKSTSDLYTRPQKFFHNIESALIISLRRALESISHEEVSSCPLHIKRYLSSVQHYTSNQYKDLDQMSGDLDQMLDQCDEDGPDYEVITIVARNLRALITHQLNPLDVFFRDGFAGRFYSSMCDAVFTTGFRRFLDLVSHERPTIRILEVGAGTGSFTNRVLSALLESETSEGTTRFLDYTFTDISTAFLNAAHERFNHFGPRMIYKQLDLESDPIKQGFEEAQYDIVLAGSVLHATSDVKVTLRNVRKLLKPLGRLIFIEMNRAVEWMNIVWGLLPGWWLSKEPWRLHSPLATEEQWSRLLLETGFTGNDIVINDNETASHHIWSLLVSTAAEEPPTPGALRVCPKIVLIVNPASPLQQSVAEEILSGRVGVIKSLAEAKSMDMRPDEIIVSLLEVGTPFFADISKEEFDELKQLALRTYSLLWVTYSGLEDPDFPKYQLMTGFFRSLRAEVPSRTFVTLAIETCLDSSPNKTAAHISQVLSALTHEHDALDMEYVVRNEVICTPRMIRAHAAYERVASLVTPKLRQESWSLGPAIKLETGSLGMLDTLRFMEDTDFDRATLAAEEVEIELKTWPVSFRDLMISLGRLEGEDDLLGLECAGPVTRVGSACSDLSPGDLVIMMKPGSTRSYPRAHRKAVIKCPDSISLEQAVSVINPAMAVYYSLITLAKLKKGEKVLIHSASGSTGQIAIHISKWLGAEVFATVGYDHKKEFLMNEFNIAKDHIFYSRDLSFSRGIMRMTKGVGVDVVLNSLSGQALQSTWECIAPYGRFVEIGKMDIQMNTPLPMGRFRNNVSFFAVDIQHISLTDLDLTQDLLRSIMDMLTSGVIQPPLPIHVFSPQRIEEAFRQIQNGQHTGRVVVTVDDRNVTKFTRNVSPWMLDSNASYVIAGGFGGLGISIVRWLVKKGAKHLIILSRFGTTSAAAANLVSELERQGIQIAAPPCDLCSPSAVHSALSECYGIMPPIKGYINSANKLQDSIFENMTYEQWDLTVRTKISSSWTLHQILPWDLDFFVLLSSVSGIYGIASQCNYAAACTYQDALARYRAAHGQRAVSFDVGWMRSVGIVAETDRFARTLRTLAHIDPVEEAELLALLDTYCDPCLKISEETMNQVMISAMAAAEGVGDGKKPTTVLRPMFSTLRPQKDSGVITSKLPAEDEASQFLSAQTLSDRQGIALKALVGKVARLLYVEPEEIDQEKCLSDYGVDSLIAVELRNWLLYDFKANVATFEILGEKSLLSLATSVAERSQLVIDG